MNCESTPVPQREAAMEYGACYIFMLLHRELVQMLGQRAVEASEAGIHPGSKSSNLCPYYGALGFLERSLF